MCSGFRIDEKAGLRIKFLHTVWLKGKIEFLLSRWVLEVNNARISILQKNKIDRQNNYLGEKCQKREDLFKKDMFHLHSVGNIQEEG